MSDADFYTETPDKAEIHEPILAVIDGTIALEAVNDFITVIEDKFRTGYECKQCAGTGRSTTICPVCAGEKVVKVSNVCDNCAGSGKVKSLFRPIGGDLKGTVEDFKTCGHCHGSGKRDMKDMPEGLYPCKACITIKDLGESDAVPSGFVPCSNCKGLGQPILMPDITKKRPSSGVVKSIGPMVKYLKCGDRVLFTNFAGHDISFKGSIKMRSMREHEVMNKIHGIGELHKVLE